MLPANTSIEVKNPAFPPHKKACQTRAEIITFGRLTKAVNYLRKILREKQTANQQTQTTDALTRAPRYINVHQSHEQLFRYLRKHFFDSISLLIFLSKSIHSNVPECENLFDNLNLRTKAPQKEAKTERQTVKWAAGKPVKNISELNVFCKNILAPGAQPKLTYWKFNVCIQQFPAQQK